MCELSEIHIDCVIHLALVLFHGKMKKGRETDMTFTPEQTTKWIEDRLASLEMNQTKFALKAGIEPAEISRYKMQKAEARMGNVVKMAEAFNIDIVFMLIILGLIDPDGSATPKLVHGHLNSKMVWKL